MLVQLSTSDHLNNDGGEYPRQLAKTEVNWGGDVAGLAEKLRTAVRGEVRFDNGSRALYATDGSNYRQIPIGVVLPVDKEDVVQTVSICNDFGAPLLSRGCGTSLAGQCCNVAVVMDMSKYMHRVLDIDVRNRLGRVEPGCILDDLRDAAKTDSLTFGPDPATHTHCTLGGMCGNNSCGIHSQMAGRTADNIHELEILTYDGVRMTVGKTSDEELANIIAGGGRRGEIYQRLRDLRDRYTDLIRKRFPRIPRRVSGYNLDQLLPENDFHVARALVGTEGTCVTILEIIGNLVWNPPGRALLVLGYPDVFASGDHIPEAQAMDYVFGFTCGVDVSARVPPPPGGRGGIDRTRMPIAGHKSYNGFSPLGPCITTKDEIGAPEHLEVKLWVSGELRPNYSTSDLAHSIAESIAWATAITPVQPGDVLFMGTNHQGLGALQDGDHVDMEITNIGRLSFDVVDPLKRRWPRGIDEVTAADVRAGTGGPGSKARPLS